MIALALPLLPMATAALLAAMRGRPRLLGPIAVGGLIVSLALGLVAAFTEPSVDWGWSPAITVGLSVQGFSRVMVVLIPAIAAPIVAYAAVTEEEGRPQLLAGMLGFSGAMLLLVSAADFLTLLLGWELVGAASWALIGHGWRDAENGRSAAQAFITTRIGDLGLYLAAGMLFAATGSFAFTDIGEASGWRLDLIAAGVLVAAAAKSAQLPFSPWLFSAMAGPTPVSALLHSATLVAAGAYLLITLSPSLEAVDWFLPAVAGVGLATALAGGVIASLHGHAKRALAGSTSAQYGLMFVAIGASSTAAAGGHLVAHAAFKSLLFLGAGVTIHAVGTSDLGGMRLGRAIPRVAMLSLVGAAALAAVPPLGGAWTKEAVVAAAGHESAWLVAGVLAAGILSAFYAFRYQVLAFEPAAARAEVHHRPGRVEVGSMAVLAGITLALSLLWLPAAERLVEDATAGELASTAAWEFAAALLGIAGAFALGWWLWRRDRLLSLGLTPRIQSALSDWLGLPTAARVLVVAPILVLSGLLARFDDRVIDAGVRGVAWLARAISRLFSLRAELSIDGVVRAVALGTMHTARGSRLADEEAVDGAVEGSAQGIGLAGRQSQRLQTGLSHHYYVILAAGVAGSVAILALLEARP